ncbi:MAG: hypothetical protein O3C40_29760 [Planctomycetota bacterium]|nr:hypothetical protein [Planctomycetota bacterium]
MTTDDERRDLVNKAVEELKHEYLIVHKDQWRAYVIRTLATLFLVGGVTVVAVLAVVWGGATATTNRKMNLLADDARKDAAELERIRTEWENGEITIKKLTITDENGEERCTINVTPDGRVALRMQDAGGNGFFVNTLSDGAELKLHTPETFSYFHAIATVRGSVRGTHAQCSGGNRNGNADVRLTTDSTLGSGLVDNRPPKE